MKYTRIDAFEMNFEECAVARRYKLNTKGVGEKRIYVGHDETSLDEFFDLENIESFILLKDDLIKYINDAEEEYYSPTQDYCEDISKYYQLNKNNTQLIQQAVIRLHFSKKYDDQKRYYLNFRDSDSSNNWDFLRNIALPRVTRLNFVKIRNNVDGKLYIYIKPIFYIDEKVEVQKEIINSIVSENPAASQVTYRKRQAQYRQNLLDIMPQCVITKVTEDRILEACHIKPFNVCSENEKYDADNGLILTPTYHKLFDLGFISFKDDGTILISPFLSNMNKARLNIAEGNTYRIPKSSSKYLCYHRMNVYNQIPDLDI